MIYEYDLIDDGGICTIELPIKLSVGSVFDHEYGRYIVTEKPKEAPDDYTNIPCDRIPKMTPEAAEYLNGWFRGK